MAKRHSHHWVWIVGFCFSSLLRCKEISQCQRNSVSKIIFFWSISQVQIIFLFSKILCIDIWTKSYLFSRAFALWLVLPSLHFSGHLDDLLGRFVHVVVVESCFSFCSFSFRRIQTTSSVLLGPFLVYCRIFLNSLEHLLLFHWRKLSLSKNSSLLVHLLCEFASSLIGFKQFILFFFCFN